MAKGCVDPSYPLMFSYCSKLINFETAEHEQVRIVLSNSQCAHGIYPFASSQKFTAFKWAGMLKRVVSLRGNAAQN